MKFNHEPVLLKETIEALNIKENGIYVDCTVGGAGHSIEILKRMGSEGRLVAIDQDEEALLAASNRLQGYKNQVYFIKCNYAYLGKILDELSIDKVDGVLMDIGVSSHQLDEKERGFSYHQDAELDMRMDKDQELTARYIVNNYDKDDLEKIFWQYGEEKWGMRIAEFIIEARKDREIVTTFDLVEIIKAAVPKKARVDKHPAKKIFQALRIEVNKELDVLETGIQSAVERLKQGGRLAIITFHSLEDRIVKNNFKELSRGCTCPSEFPVCVCNRKEIIKVINKRPITATEEELKNNNRSRSAKLRVCEKL
ncbi:16S rRNA (cytosine(1402)-N(4))-methyltransferase RsmH [Helcococcus ovis]|uniref:Ribosomal RNA small subunit methyltransferase H n=2 Tax=Helcococcus ovis TaxID=72026 RepID=A0A4R9C4D9_9FIRM|nr:16S rRNA (cytosine(1402)-N(4))-methyltransferase RsmH [Helcococcus ovis]TFF64180.1 16S rRNA (cytosine(1402)-N(4))-methyltransferase RsmH [Helcococcus ovis]TFF66456.1 16S rRNA (cytosine(1402)-N(4))-methyltransferase RsmH [Helcococcus ovis]TFF66934.1 16S rRNA (cytosine(1402)-N(4))-methyltransferase RsmH [Helcococcus ovis]WNZ01848.1 16S rRNA (cytosine(1402)-N(4))-methyltransferase RsmH [Helcococcus ovis]